MPWRTRAWLPRAVVSPTLEPVGSIMTFASDAVGSQGALARGCARGRADVIVDDLGTVRVDVVCLELELATCTFALLIPMRWKTFGTGAGVGQAIRAPLVEAVQTFETVATAVLLPTPCQMELYNSCCRQCVVTFDSARVRLLAPL